MESASSSAGNISAGTQKEAAKDDMTGVDSDDDVDKEIGGDGNGEDAVVHDLLDDVVNDVADDDNRGAVTSKQGR